MKRITIPGFLCILLAILLLQLSCRKSVDQVEPKPSPVELIETELNTVFDSIIENTHVPGIVAGIWAPNEGIELIYEGGYADLETKETMDSDMLFRIASNTKTFAITILLQLVDEGKISLDDKLSQYYPDFPRGNEVTIEMLTNMRSGIGNYVERLEFWEMVFADPTHFWTIDEILELNFEIFGENLYYFDPGTGFHYSNTNTIIIEGIIEMVSGISLESLITQSIINNLSLVNTSYIIGGCHIPGYHSKAYYFGEYDESFPELSEYLDYSFARAAGGMISNIYDLKVYVKALVEGDFVSQQLQEKRMDVHEISPATSLRYGIGMMESGGFYGHNGGAPGYTSLMVHSPDRNCTIVVWYNCNLGGADPTQLLDVIPQIIYSDIND